MTYINISKIFVKSIGKQRISPFRLSEKTIKSGSKIRAFPIVRSKKEDIRFPGLRVPEAVQ